jgi:LysM repeat protein
MDIATIVALLLVIQAELSAIEKNRVVPHATVETTMAETTYTVQPGDTLPIVAQKLAISISDLKGANPMLRGALANLKPGWVLQLPATSPQE